MQMRETRNNRTKKAELYTLIGLESITVWGCAVQWLEHPPGEEEMGVGKEKEEASTRKHGVLMCFLLLR